MSLKKVRFLQQFKNRQSACIISELQLWYLKYLPEKKPVGWIWAVFFCYIWAPSLSSTDCIFHRFQMGERERWYWASRWSCCISLVGNYHIRKYDILYAEDSSKLHRTALISMWIHACASPKNTNKTNTSSFLNRKVSNTIFMN